MLTFGIDTYWQVNEPSAEEELRLRFTYPAIELLSA